MKDWSNIPINVQFLKGTKEVYTMSPIGKAQY